MDISSFLSRWDRMQEHYLVARDERFAIMAHLVQTTQGNSPLILDLGCGTGSVMVTLLDAIPGSRAIGVDMDPTLLRLAETRLAVYGGRASVFWADLRQADWVKALPAAKVNAVVSATALHWLAPEQLAALYAQIASLLKPAGIFLNADHVASDNPLVQKAWEQHRQQMRLAQFDPRADDWDAFWSAYLAELGPPAAAERQRILGPWNGIEDGMSLVWQFDHLKQAGLSSVDCFCRLDCDAIFTAA